MSEEFAHNPDFPFLETYNWENMDKLFGDSPGDGMECSPFRDFAIDEEMEDIIQVVFHLDGDI